MDTQLNNRSSRVFPVILSLLLVSVWATTTICAQEQSTQQVVSREIPLRYLSTAPGVLISEGTNALPIGPFGIKTYRLEEVLLKEPIELNLRGHMTPIETAFRLTIIGESFRQGGVTIWINDEPVSDPMSGGTQVTTIIFDRELLEEDASISVTSDLVKDEQMRWTLPDRLQLPARLRSSQTAKDKHENTVRMRRVESIPGKPAIIIELRSLVPYPIRNASLVLQIGAAETMCGDNFTRDRHTLTCYLEVETFDRLNEGDGIRLKYGPGPTVPSYQRFGRLNKSLVDK